MTTFNNTSPWKQAPEAISMPAPSAPRNSFAQPILPSLRPPSGAAPPLFPHVQSTQLTILLAMEKMGAQVHNLTNLRLSELSLQLSGQASGLETALVKYLPPHIKEFFFPILTELEEVSKVMNRLVRETETFLIQREQSITQFDEMCRYVTTMQNQNPTNLWRPQPEKWKVNSSSDYEKGRENPEAAESFGRHSSFAPVSPTFGSNHMDPGDPQSGETLMFNSVSEENRKSVKTSLPPTGGHFATGEVQDDLSHWSETQEEGSGYPDSTSSCDSQHSAEDEGYINDFIVLFDEVDL